MAASGTDAVQSSRGARKKFDRCAAIEKTDERLACYDALADALRERVEEYSFGEWRDVLTVRRPDGSWTFVAAVPGPSSDKHEHHPAQLVWSCRGGLRTVWLKSGKEPPENARVLLAPHHGPAREFATEYSEGVFVFTDPNEVTRALSSSRKVRLTLEGFGGPVELGTIDLEPGFGVVKDAMAVCGVKKRLEMFPDQPHLYEIIDANRITAPEIVLRPLPSYPRLARRLGVSANVRLLCRIRRNGKVRVLRVLSSPEQDIGFTDAAIDAVNRWRYRPAKIDGEPVETEVTVSLDFHPD